ncbi:acyloxyacyl hydrolase [Alistipes shahii]|uniref:acyloxyacyl hydrolase n=1 Tax=Alistipes shahii TaxID=328814 RepID=UPI0032C06A17
MKFALRAPILKYTLFGMLFLNSPAQASEPRSKRMEKTAAEVIAADSAAIPKGWDNDCRASYKAGYEAGYRAGYLHGRRTATQPHSSGRASATRYADGSIVPTRDTTASGRRFMHRIGAEFRPEYIFPTNPFVEGENRAGQPIDLSLSGHLRYSFQFRPGSIPDQIYGGAYQGIGAAYYDFGNPDELGNPIAVYLFQGARIARISPRLSFNYEWNFGLSFGWKPYDDAVNPLNKMMGSKMNAYLNADFFLDWRVTREVDFTAGLSLTHFSNGNTKFPNAGLNAVGLRAGLTYNFGRKSSEMAPRTVCPAFPRHFSYDLTFFGSWRRKGIEVGDKQYAAPDAYTVLGFNFASMYNFGYKFRAGVSLDGVYDGSANVAIADQIVEMGSSADLAVEKPGVDRQLALGVSARAEFVMPYFNIGVGLGTNFLHKGGDLKAFYQMLILKVAVTRSSYVHIGYSLRDFHMPNFLMLGVGYRFNNKYPRHR